jgi:hypothetical protein
MIKYDDDHKQSKCSCDVCDFINARPIELERNGVQLVTVRIKVNNVCVGKKVAVAAIIYDQFHRILAFKGFITMVREKDDCEKDKCGTIERKIVFVLPDEDECNPLELEACTIANYIYPCEPVK